MAKLSQIIEPFALALGIPTRSMNVLAMVIRKGGLITKGGRGQGGAEMQASDCTNLLLSVMASGEATSADERVLFVRSATTVSESIQVPSVSFVKETLGETLDSLFEEMIHHGDPVDVETGKPITNLALTISQPNDFGASASIWIDDGGLGGTIRFHRNGRAFDGIPRDRVSEVARTLKLPVLRFDATADLGTLFELAEIIRGDTNPDSPS